MLSYIYHHIVLGMNTITCDLNTLHVCPFIVTKIIAKIIVRKFDFSQMTLRKISHLNSTSLEEKMKYMNKEPKQVT